MSVVTSRSLLLYCGLLLACAASAFGGGAYQQTKDGKTTVWNSNPRSGDTATWFGDRDRDGYANGVGTLTWYTGSGALYARYYGNMVRGKLDGAVNVHTKGKTAHAFFTDGMRTSRWAGGAAPSRRVPPEFAESDKQRAQKQRESEQHLTRNAEPPKSSPSPPPVSAAPEAPAEKTPEPQETKVKPDESISKTASTATPAPAATSTPDEILMPPSPSPSPSSSPSPSPSPTPSPSPSPKSTPRPTATPSRPKAKRVAPSPDAKKKNGVDSSLQLLIGPPKALRSPAAESPAADSQSQSASSPASATQLTKEDAMLLSDAEARTAGYDLNNYHRPKAEYDASNETWGLVYDRKPGDGMTGPAHLNMTVDDKTKKAAVASPR